jgi:predicted DNA-binding transcriptional regulator AlpA
MSDRKALAKSRLLTIPELRARLRVSRSSAYRVARAMEHIELGGRLLVPEAAVDAYVEARLRSPAQAPVRTLAPRSTSQAWTLGPTTPVPVQNSRRPIEVRTRGRRRST